MYKKVKESNGGDGVSGFVVPCGRGADFLCLGDDDFVGDAVMTLDELRSEDGVALQFVAKFRLRAGQGTSQCPTHFFSGYERDEAFPQDTDLSPVPLSRLAFFGKK